MDRRLTDAHKLVGVFLSHQIGLCPQDRTGRGGEVEQSHVGNIQATLAAARNKVREHLRMKRTGLPVLSPDVFDAVADAAPQLDDGWSHRREALAVCMEKVAQRAREILELRYTDGLHPQDIAQRLSWTTGAVNVALARSRKFLRDCAQRRISIAGDAV